MKGFIAKVVAGSCLGASLTALIGCTHYRDIVDPCWPVRYDSMARQSVRDMSNAQADKGHVLDQTVWNWEFEVDPKTGAPTERLTGAGIETLKYIARRLPCPDYQIYLQNAQDIPYVTGIAPDRLVAQRSQLNERRMQAIHAFLATQVTSHGSGAYQIAIHDFAPPSLPARYTEQAEQNLEKNIKSGTPQIFTAPKN
jgi:hypothetical protein